MGGLFGAMPGGPSGTRERSKMGKRKKYEKALRTDRTLWDKEG